MANNPVAETTSSSLPLEKKIQKEKSETPLLSHQKDELERDIEDFTKQMGITLIGQSNPPDVLNAKISDLKGWSQENLAEASYELGLYATAVQRELNKYRMWERWATSKIDECAAAALTNIGSDYGWNERMLIAKHNTPAARVLNDFLRRVRSRIDILSYIPNEVHKMSENIKELRYSRRVFNNG